MRHGEAGGIWRTTPFACAGPSGRRVQRCVTSTATASPAVPTIQPNISWTGSRSPVTPVDVTVSPPATTRSVPYMKRRSGRSNLEKSWCPYSSPRAAGAVRADDGGARGRAGGETVAGAAGAALQGPLRRAGTLVDADQIAG